MRWNLLGDLAHCVTLNFFLSPSARLLAAAVSQGGRDDGELEQENYHKRTLQIYQVKFDRLPEPQSEHILSHSEHDLTENVPKNCQKNAVIGLNHKT